MLSIYIPALISLLNLEQCEVIQSSRLLSSSSAQRVMLHEQSLKKLTEIGPKYTEEFKQIMASNASYSESLKSAIRNQQKKATSDSDKSGAAANNRSNASTAGGPAFQLKVDISKYK